MLNPYNLLLVVYFALSIYLLTLFLISRRKIDYESPSEYSASLHVFLKETILRRVIKLVEFFERITTFKDPVINWIIWSMIILIIGLIWVIVH